MNQQLELEFGKLKLHSLPYILFICQLRLFHLFLLGYELQARMEVQHCNVIERLIEVTENENLPT